MRERIWLSNFNLDDIRGGTELLGNQFCKAMNLKYFSARKAGIPLEYGNIYIAKRLDDWVKMLDLELLIFNSVNCWSRKPTADKSVAVCCEHFKKESECLNNDRWKKEKTEAWNHQKMSLNNADKIITISEEERDAFEEDGFDSTVIEPYIDLEVFQPDFSKRDKIALFVGRRHMRKGYDIFTKLSELYPKYKFVDITDGDILVDDLVSLYNKAAFLLMPTRYESFGYIYAEALATNTPIISSRTGLFGKWQPDAYGIFPEEITVEAFSDAINKFERRSFEPSRKLAEKRFSKKRFGEDCNEVFGNW